MTTPVVVLPACQTVTLLCVSSSEWAEGTTHRSQNYGIHFSYAIVQETADVNTLKQHTDNVLSVKDTVKFMFMIIFNSP